MMAGDGGARSKFFFYNTMSCLLKALEGKKVTVEIRNDITIHGTLDSVESTMNLNLSDVTWKDVKGRRSRFTKFFIRSRQIRFVHIPDEVDIVRAMKWQINKGQYFLEKERREKQRIFERKQKIREKRSRKLQKQEQN